MSGDLGDGSESLAEPLLAHRVVMLRGYLDAALATSVAGQLMALDAWGDGRVQLHIGSPGGELDAALMLMDTIGAMGVPVETIGSGEVSGPAIGVLAVARPRFVTAHTIIKLELAPVAAEGTAAELMRLARRAAPALRPDGGGGHRDACGLAHRRPPLGSRPRPRTGAAVRPGGLRAGEDSASRI